MRNSFIRVAVGLALPWGAAAVTTPAASQTRDTTPITLPGLDVRVTRSAVPPERLPFAVSATRPAPGVLAGATAADAALRGIPGVEVSNRFNDDLGERITIRGMGARAQFGIRGVRVVVDGIPATMPDGQTTLTHMDPTEVTSTEVLRGAAGALWGNASGGVVLFRTAPVASTFASARATFAAYGLRRLSAAAALEPFENAVLHGRLTTQEFDGYRDHSVASKRLASFGGGWAGGRNRVWMAAHAVDSDGQNPGSLTRAQVDSARLQANANNVRQNVGESGTHVQVGGGWQRTEDAGMLDVSGYLLQRDISNPIPPSIIDLGRTAGGARVAFGSPSTKMLIMTAGVEASAQFDDRVTHTNLMGVRGARTIDQRERVWYAAPFAQAVVGVSTAVDGMIAVRWDRYRFSTADRLITAVNPDDSGARTLSSPTVATGVRMRIGNGSIYGNYATSFQTPTTSELGNRPDGAGGFNPDLAPEQTRSLEAGGTLTVGPMRAEFAGYHARVTDALIAFEVPAQAGRQFFRNAGRVVNRGIEFAAHVSPVDAVQFSAAYSHVDARFGEYVVGSTDYSGNEVPGVTRSTLSGATALMFTRGARVDANVAHRGEVAVDDANTSASPRYTLVDVGTQSPAVRIRGLRLRGSAGVNNMFDVRYNTAVTVNAFAGRYFEPGPGRTLYVSVTAGVGRSQ